MRLSLGFLLCVLLSACATHSATRQKSLNEWRALTSPAAEPPRVFVRGDQVQFYFPTEVGVEAFSAHWRRLRVPTAGYKVNSALLHWNQRLSRMPEGVHGWREATVIAGVQWRRLMTNLVGELTPPNPGHGYYYEAFLAGRLFYRDTNGAAHLAAPGEQPANVTIQHRFSVEETLEVVSRVVEQHLARDPAASSLFLLMAPNGNRFAQPLLVDREQRQCVSLTPAALYDHAEGGLGLTATGQGLEALFIEGHGVALLKNPVSSAARLLDLGVQTLVRFIHLPIPRSKGNAPPLAQGAGMSLDDWEAWLDYYTGTRREDGSLQLLIDGDQFYPRLQQAIAEATNHIHLNVYIFDRDDIAVGVADQLRQRSSQVEVKVIFDRLGSIAAGVSPPATPVPEDFEFPSSILSHLRNDSRVEVRPFLNPWFSADHSKIFLVDGTRAWVGGMNLGREYRFEWHDFMVEMEGPIVASLENCFRLNWAHEGPLGDLSYAAALLSGPREAPATPPSDRWIRLRRLPTRTGWKPFEAAVLASLRKARNYIYVENPYLFDKRVVAALIRARLRGVDVRVVLPEVNDFKAGGRSNLMTANDFLQNGVRVFFYPGMTHVKALLVDGWSCVGSGNLNNLSLRLAHEENIATSDPRFAAQLKKELFEEDFARSYELKEPISVDWEDFLSDVMMENF